MGDVIGFAHAGMTAEGDNRVLMQKVTKETMAFYAKGKYLPPKQEQKIDFTSIDFSQTSSLQLQQLIALFVAREMTQFKLLDQRMSAKMKKDAKSIFDVWMLEESDLVQSAANAHGDRVVLIANAQACADYAQKNAADKETQSVLVSLCRLFALRRLELDIQYLLTSQLLQVKQAEQISDGIRALCKELAVHSLALVKAFGSESSDQGAADQECAVCNSRTQQHRLTLWLRQFSLRRLLSFSS